MSNIIGKPKMIQNILRMPLNRLPCGEEMFSWQDGRKLNGVNWRRVDDKMRIKVQGDGN